MRLTPACELYLHTRIDMGVFSGVFSEVSASLRPCRRDLGGICGCFASRMFPFPLACTNCSSTQGWRRILWLCTNTDVLSAPGAVPPCYLLAGLPGSQAVCPHIGPLKVAGFPEMKCGQGWGPTLSRCSQGYSGALVSSLLEIKIKLAKQTSYQLQH